MDVECTECDEKQSVSIFEETCKHCGSTDLRPAND